MRGFSVDHYRFFLLTALQSVLKLNAPRILTDCTWHLCCQLVTSRAPFVPAKVVYSQTLYMKCNIETPCWCPSPPACLRLFPPKLPFLPDFSPVFPSPRNSSPLFQCILSVLNICFKYSFLYSIVPASITHAEVNSVNNEINKYKICSVVGMC